METMQLKHILAYAPYGVDVIIVSEETKKYPVRVIGYELHVGTGNKVTIKVYDSGIKLPFYVNMEDVKLVLRPLYDITEDIFVEQFFEDKSDLLGDEYTPLCQAIFFLQNSNPLEVCFPNGIWELFYRHHFDIFGFIEKGLAVDINTII